ncbi:MAG: metal-dependent hydrolase [Oxalobacter sp.]|jgi:ABC-2 type transport system permease protein|nr:MAG: metal-dependent hydrolase [Oxalobacter sp.]
MILSIGFRTLLYKEVLRFVKVAGQTITAPVLTAVLYLLVFGHALEAHVQAYPGVSYTAFLIPGLVMMSVLQNAFANTSSSLIQSKMNGSMVFLLLSPISYWETYWAYLLAAIVRGVTVGVGVFAVTVWFAPLSYVAPWWIALFGVLGAAILGTMGLIAGLWAEKYDHLATFQNFLIMPATFLSGVFYTIRSLPETWQAVSHANPFFYLVDGFRYGFYGQSDVAPLLSLAVGGAFFLLLACLAVWMLKKGYKLRH